MNLGENIKKYRKQKNMSQQELSELSGIPRASISRYENGERTPNVEIVNKIASALNLNINQLTGTRKTVIHQLIDFILSEENITIDELAHKSNIPVDEFIAMYKSEDGYTLETYRKFLTLFNEDDERIVEAFYQDMLTNAVYNKSDSESLKIKKMLFNEPLTREELLEDVHPEDKEFIAQIYDSGILNNSNNSSNNRTILADFGKAKLYNNNLPDHVIESLAMHDYFDSEIPFSTSNEDTEKTVKRFILGEQIDKDELIQSVHPDDRKFISLLYDNGILSKINSITFNPNIKSSAINLSNVDDLPEKSASNINELLGLLDKQYYKSKFSDSFDKIKNLALILKDYDFKFSISEDMNTVKVSIDKDDFYEEFDLDDFMDFIDKISWNIEREIENLKELYS